MRGILSPDAMERPHAIHGLRKSHCCGIEDPFEPGKLFLNCFAVFTHVSAGDVSVFSIDGRDIPIVHRIVNAEIDHDDKAPLIEAAVSSPLH
ncbi:hypothetical protein Pmar_PMAR001093 [Perkinsus marinus ATCC 50983]|uniref:Signal peptidase I n=1 Tax=Perkinsus marinus (strain ATCC 50983 / TXsc) TaxID=423536 RepID=C5KSU6_PERM5|nr:hypothetical protein Pmar_PMAR001093 [Perkinsus marinus ATCC 50983]EER12296.1 hypothetical protein Pmar_PMAR001093 [Perkinsus marinus ATCC 50983]|eukprot:XP_002780501.1 hypothetical protein Pmar_PMAR001093 [Perkinsus marinus ATCC 50983]